MDKLKWPSYINCAFCPAQAYPNDIWAETTTKNRTLLQQYKCVCGHLTYVLESR